jgi:hypothetical protein
MKTVHDLKEVKFMFPVASAKPGNSVVKIYDSIKIHNNVLIENYPSPEEAENIILDIIESTYNSNLHYVKDLFHSIYGREFRIGNKLSDLLIKIKKIMIETNKTIEEIVLEIRNYLGYNCSFNRLQNNKLVPCDSTRILNAYNLVKEKKSLITIENCLYL